MTITKRRYANAVCTACASIVPLQSGALVECHVCGAEVVSPAQSDAYRYAEATIYYGYQYRTLFERQQGEANPPKYSLSFIGEAFTFIALAAVSGVIGNLTYDVVKSALIRIRDQARDRAHHGADYKAVGELTDDDLDRMYDYSKSFAQGFADIEKTIREDLMEEMLADSMGDAVAHNPELLAILSKKHLSADEQEKVIAALTAAMKRQPYAEKPPSSVFTSFWKSLSQ